MLGSHDIQLAYRLVLGRQADESGLLHYEGRAPDGLSFADLRREMINSAEHRAKFGTLWNLVPLADFQVAVDPFEPEFGTHIANTGIWEPHIVGAIRDHLGPGATFIDIGANVGIMSFVASRAVGDAGRVIAFEPHPENIRMFRAGLSANAFRNVEIYGFALSDKTSTFAVCGSSNGYLAAPTARHGDEPFPERSDTYRAIGVSGDPILQDLGRVDLIKIDIEGHEPFALAGIPETIRRYRPTIICEFNPRCLIAHAGVNPHDFADQLYTMAKAISIIEHDGKVSAVSSATELMRMWHERDTQEFEAARLPKGAVHFDLLIHT